MATVNDPRPSNRVHPAERDTGEDEEVDDADPLETKREGKEYAYADDEEDEEENEEDDQDEADEDDG